MENIKRGQIYYCKFDGVGSEYKGVRPVVVLQNNVGNKYSTTTIVAPCTSRDKNFLLHVPIDCENMNKKTWVCLEHIYTISKDRLFSYVGEVNNMDEIDKKLKVSLGLK